MGRVVILSGVSGSGKSTSARKLWNDLEPGNYCKVVSADDFFMVDGEYKFDPTKLSDAHGKCFREYISVLNDGVHTASGFKSSYDLVVVDNTNTTAVEIAPYILGAQAYGWEVEILTVMCETEADIKACAARNAHGVSFEGVLRQHTNLKMRQLMPWWKNTVVRVEVG